MNIFYAPEIKATPLLPKEESHHCVKVLRKSVGDEINIVDGAGGKYKAELIDADARGCKVGILEEMHQTPRPYQVHIAIAPTKNIARFEWFLEKSTEIGVDAITPVLCRHSERKHIKPGRLEKILIGAMKQSLKAYKPVLNAMMPLDELIKRPPPGWQLFIGHSGGNPPHLKGCYGKHKNTLVLIGPEGDFSDDEIFSAEKNGFQRISLGPDRLRTETAGIVACTIVNLLNV